MSFHHAGLPSRSRREYLERRFQAPRDQKRKQPEELTAALTSELWLRFELESLNVLCLPAFRTLHDIKLHCLTLLKAAEALRLDSGVVDENVFAALPADETETFRIVKPLNGTLFHYKISLLN